MASRLIVPIAAESAMAGGMENGKRFMKGGLKRVFTERLGKVRGTASHFTKGLLRKHVEDGVDLFPIACYGLALSDSARPTFTHVAYMWTDLSRPATNWLPILSTCCVVAAVITFAGPSEVRAHAAELAAAEIEASPSGNVERQGTLRMPTERSAPEKAYELLEALQRRKGEPLPGYVGGKLFRNRERRLPFGRYKEYDVNRRIPGRSRDAERLVIEQETGKAYYTNDHYRTFVPLN
jgi:guanyl-specific ribonuclease Sa